MLRYAIITQTSQTKQDKNAIKLSVAFHRLLDKNGRRAVRESLETAFKEQGIMVSKHHASHGTESVRRGKHFERQAEKNHHEPGTVLSFELRSSEESSPELRKKIEKIVRHRFSVPSVR